MNPKRKIPQEFKAVAIIEYSANVCRWIFGFLSIVIIYYSIKDFLVFKNTYFPFIEAGKLVIVESVGSVNSISILKKGYLINQPKVIRIVQIGDQKKAIHKKVQNYYSPELKNKQRGDTIVVWYLANSLYTRAKLKMNKRELYERESKHCQGQILFSLIIFFPFYIGYFAFKYFRRKLQFTYDISDEDYKLYMKNRTKK